MPNNVEKAWKWLRVLEETALPKHAALSAQIKAGSVSGVCECGCNGFDFHVPDRAGSEPLQGRAGLFCELAFTSNFSEEIDILVFTDDRGFLARVDVTYGYSNIGPMPDEIEPTSLLGIWPAVAEFGNRS
jgi:hypothetical protein